MKALVQESSMVCVYLSPWAVEGGARSPRTRAQWRRRVIWDGLQTTCLHVRVCSRNNMNCTCK